MSSVIETLLELDVSPEGPVIIGSSILTYTVLSPRPDIFVPFYFVGSSTGLYAAILRKTPWVTVLTGWFTIMNTIALYQLFLI